MDAGRGRRRGTFAVDTFAVERLEPRLPLAGDVGLFVYGGNLRVVGGFAANDLAIAQSAPGTFSITGNDGETFRLNGSPVAGPVTVTGITRSITVALGFGDDAVAITGLSASTTLAANLAVVAGPGVDTVTISSARIDGPLVIDTGFGDWLSDGDAVTVSDVNVAGPLAINTGFGDDSVSIDGVTARQGAVNTGFGADVVSIASGSAVVFDSLVLTLGWGDDSVAIGSGTLTLAKRQSLFFGGLGTNTLTGISNLAPGSVNRLTWLAFSSVS